MRDETWKSNSSIRNRNFIVSDNESEKSLLCFVCWWPIWVDFDVSVLHFNKMKCCESKSTWTWNTSKKWTDKIRRNLKTNANFIMNNFRKKVEFLFKQNSLKVLSKWNLMWMKFRKRDKRLKKMKSERKTKTQLKWKWEVDCEYKQQSVS
jgi:hypothetical protein